jgi:hypothetical protein
MGNSVASSVILKSGQSSWNLANTILSVNSATTHLPHRTVQSAKQRSKASLKSRRENEFSYFLLL